MTTEAGFQIPISIAKRFVDYKTWIMFPSDIQEGETLKY